MMDIKQIEMEVVLSQTIADRNRIIIKLIDENQELKGRIRQLEEKIAQFDKVNDKDTT